jgi:hypothetical protein
VHIVYERKQHKSKCGKLSLNTYTVNRKVHVASHVAGGDVAMNDVDRQMTVVRFEQRSETEIGRRLHVLVDI